MKENLVIIESPNKIKTIEKYLGNKYKVMATIGHIRDISKRGLGFDEKTFEPKWTISKTSKKGEKSKAEIIKNINEAADKAKNIYLASDPDREGEAIAWHVYEILSKKNQKKALRITFNEISKEALEDSLQNPRKIDMLWVQSQFARRLLDRIVGYGLSKLVKKKIKAESAGRVQTVALKFIADREKEIAKFKSSKWWTLDVTLQDDVKLNLRDINPKLSNIKLVKQNDDEKGSGIDFKDVDSANKVKDNLKDTYEIYAIDDPKSYIVNPKDPYKTSTMQQDAINKLGWNLNKATSIAQKLYEGVDIDGSQTALISYPRTDSTRISESFSNRAKAFIKKTYGDKYLSTKDKKTNTNNVNKIQDAHEAIRCIDPSLTPLSLKKKIGKDEWKLYQLIWSRTIASFMSPAQFENVIIRLVNNNNKFYTYNRKLIFDGYRKVYSDYDDKNKIIDSKISKSKVGTKFKAKEILVKEHETTPPPRYNQASLVKALDEAGVGRPSTYRTMANMALQRGYATLENRAYVMTNIGNEVISSLQEHFPYITDTEFTKEMEEHLDDIASKEENWKEWIKEFKPMFDKDVKKADKTMEEVQPEKVGRTCPKCGNDLIYCYNKKNHSKFIGCSNYPNCNYVESLNPPKILDEKCPKCGKPLVERYSIKRHHKFIGCTGFPKCDYIRNNDAKKQNQEKESNND